MTGPWSCLENHSWRQGKHFPLASASFGPLDKKVQRPLRCLGLGPGPAASWFLVVPEGPPCKASPPHGDNGSAFCCCYGSVNRPASSVLGGRGVMEGGDPSYEPGTSPLRTARLLEAGTLSYLPMFPQHSAWHILSAQANVSGNLCDPCEAIVIPPPHRTEATAPCYSTPRTRNSIKFSFPGQTLRPRKTQSLSGSFRL